MDINNLFALLKSFRSNLKNELNQLDLTDQQEKWEKVIRSFIEQLQIISSSIRVIRLKYGFLKMGKTFWSDRLIPLSHAVSGLTFDFKAIINIPNFVIAAPKSLPQLLRQLEQMLTQNNLYWSNDMQNLENVCGEWKNASKEFSDQLWKTLWPAK